MATAKLSIWRCVICEICNKNWLKSPISGLQSGRYNLHFLIRGHHCQLDDQCRDAINNDKDCWVGQLTRSSQTQKCWLYVYCKSLPFFLFSNFRKGRLLYICPVGWSVDVNIIFFIIYRHKSPLITQYPNESVPLYINQHHPILTHYHPAPASTTKC